MGETRTATVQVEAGLLVVRIRPGLRQTVEDARANIDTCAATSNGGRPGLLLDLRKAVSLDPPVRHFYTGSVVLDVCSALALLVETSPLGRMMGNVYLRVANPGIPTRVFADESKARGWLTRQAQPSGNRA